MDPLERRIVHVESLEDPRLALYRDLRDRDLALEDETFIAESARVLRVLLGRSRFPVRSIFLAASRLRKMADALVTAPPEVPIYVAGQALLDQVIGFHIHRGVLAAGVRLPVPGPAELLGSLPGGGPQRIVILEGLTNHDNVGGVFRNAAAFGASAVLLDRATCDPLYRKAIRVSVGGALIVPYARAETTEELLAAARGAGFSLLALSPQRDLAGIPSMDIAELTEVRPRVALVLGTEGEGLRESTVRLVDSIVRIDIAPGFDSLNVATAGGIALHAIRTLQLAAAPRRG